MKTIILIILILLVCSCRPLHVEKIDKYIVRTYPKCKVVTDTTNGETHRLTLHELGYQKYPELDYSLFTTRTPRFK